VRCIRVSLYGTPEVLYGSKLGIDRISCVSADVECTGSVDKYSFWIMEKQNLVLSAP